MKNKHVGVGIAGEFKDFQKDETNCYYLIPKTVNVCSFTATTFNNFLVFNEGQVRRLCIVSAYRRVRDFRVFFLF